MRKYFIVGFTQNGTKWFLGPSVTSNQTAYGAVLNEKLAIQFPDKSSAISRLRDFLEKKQVERILVHQVEETLFVS